MLSKPLPNSCDDDTDVVDKCNYGVGGTHGEMGVYASPANSTFWMHNANLDRVWWL